MSKVKFGLSNVKVALRTESEGTATYGHCYKVEVEESSNNSTIYVKDEDGSDCGFSQKG